MTAVADSSGRSDRLFFVVATVISVGALSFLAWLLLFRETTSTELDRTQWSFVPALNAGLNATSALLLVMGWRAIRLGQRERHRWMMIGAFACSTLFLVGYVAYHYMHGDTPYRGPARPAYLAMLASHVVLSMPVVPLSLAAFYFAWRERYETHRRITRWLAPIWLYVSITGVLVYLFLHVLSR